jgi:outer membrane biosynthesis protein TonB
MAVLATALYLIQGDWIAALHLSVVVVFTISATGAIEDARATRNTTGDDALGACLVNQVRVWELPAPPGGALELAMPFSR